VYVIDINNYSYIFIKKNYPLEIICKNKFMAEMYTYVFIVSTNILSYFLKNKINYSFNKSKKGENFLEIGRITVKLLRG